MKTTITLLIALLISISSFAQQGINYKAIVKDGSGNLIISQPINLRFTIQKSNGTGVYTETHSPTTDANGIIVANIGEGVAESGDFLAIDWANDFYQLQTEIDLTGSYVIIGSAEPFKAVPMAIQSQRSELATVALTANNVTTKLDQLIDARSDDDGSQNGSSVFLGLDSGITDDGTNNRNVGLGFETLKENTTGYNNIGNGHSALKNNTTGHSNIANGANALLANTSGSENTAIGTNALLDNINGSQNTATGVSALESNTTGDENTAQGYFSLSSNTRGSWNTASGSYALFKNINGNGNTANGHSALHNNINGQVNTAIGYFAMYKNISGNHNTAIGFHALYDNTSGEFNVANGASSLGNNTTGNQNAALGNNALGSNNEGGGNTAIGFNALGNNTVGGQNTALGNRALRSLTSGSNNIGIGYFANVPDPAASNQIRLGNEAITSASMQVGWNITSDIIWKDNIRILPYGLDLVMQMQPVDYTRKNNDKQTREMGFIAQDVEALLAKVGYTDQGFLTKDDKGYISLRYNDLIALLTKAIQEQQDIIDGQKTQIKKLATENTSLTDTVFDLISRVEKIEANNQ